MSTPKLINTAKEICEHYNFLLVRFAGKGAFKETFLINDSGTKKALKVFYPHKFDKQRTDREFDSILRCDHPNIGKVFKFEEFNSSSDRFNFSIEEFLDGGTLTSKLINITKSESISIGLKITDAIEHLKDLNLVHRDLKPDNILFRDNTYDNPVIVDFGLVRDLDDSSLTPSFIPSGPGTPLYSSPEQLNNEKNLIDWRSDQFSLGIILSVCLTKTHPFKNSGENNHAAIARIQKRKGVANEFLEKTKNEKISEILNLLAPWPIKRANSIEEMKNIIKELSQ